jgi:hypothetical protein
MNLSIWVLYKQYLFVSTSKTFFFYAYLIIQDLPIQLGADANEKKDRLGLRKDRFDLFMACLFYSFFLEFYFLWLDKKCYWFWIKK